MLQISNGRYFREGADLNETLHRAVLHTNGWTRRRQAIDLPFGRFEFSTVPDFTPAVPRVSAVTIEVVDRMEAERPDGTRDVMTSTHGREHIDAAAAVFAFAAGITLTRGREALDRSVPSSSDLAGSTAASRVMPRLFDPGVELVEGDIARVAEFGTRLLALKRTHFDAAMNAIRRTNDAALMAGDDPSLAYTLLVAALESFIELVPEVVVPHDWDAYDGRKRRLIDDALDGAAEDQAERVRAAVLEIDQLSLRRRFLACTAALVQPSYYRAEAAGVRRPVRAHDLHRALDVAYQMRSGHVHTLRVLAPELWAVTDRADTVWWKGRPALSIAGLHRLCCHVVKTFIDRSPTELDTAFDWRRARPGIVTMQVAAQHWVWNATGFDQRSAPRYLEGLLEIWCELGADEAPGLPEMSAVLERVEELLQGLATPKARAPMVALYLVWHQIVTAEHHRPAWREVVQRHAADLDELRPTLFALAVMQAIDIQWSPEEVVDLATEREDEVRRGRGQPLPVRFDAALFSLAAVLAREMGHELSSDRLVAAAVGCLPGDPGLCRFEAAVKAGSVSGLDPLALIHSAPVWFTTTDDPREDGVVRLRPGLEIDGEALASFARRHGVRRLSAFGSVTRADFGDDSDVDLLVEFEPGSAPGLLTVAMMEIELGELLGREVDLRTVNDLSRHFRDEVVASARELYAA